MPENSNNSEKYRRKLKKRQLKKRRKQFIRDEKRSIRRQRKKLKKELQPRKKRMRAERLYRIRNQFINFFKSPFKRSRKKIDHQERVFKKHLREDLRNQRRNRLRTMPQRFLKRIRKSFQVRKEKLEFTRMEFSGNYYKLFDLVKKGSNLKDLTITFFNSLFAFILAFWIMYYISQLASIIVAGNYSIPAVLHSYRIFWPLYTYSSLYTRQALIVIFGVGPLVCLALAFGLYHFYNRIKNGNRYIKIVTWWLVFHGMNMFFGAYISGVITRTGFVYAIEWLFYSRVFGIQEIIFVIVSVVVLVGFGLYSARQFILATNSKAIVEPSIRLAYVAAQVFFPWVIGFVIIYFSNFPHNPPELILLYIISALIVIPVLFNFNSTSNRYIKVQFNEAPVKLVSINIVLFILLLVLIRIFIYPGINFS